MGTMNKKTRPSRTLVRNRRDISRGEALFRPLSCTWTTHSRLWRYIYTHADNFTPMLAPKRKKKSIYSSFELSLRIRGRVQGRGGGGMGEGGGGVTDRGWAHRASSIVWALHHMQEKNPLCSLSSVASQPYSLPYPSGCLMQEPPVDVPNTNRTEIFNTPFFS